MILALHSVETDELRIKDIFVLLVAPLHLNTNAHHDKDTCALADVVITQEYMKHEK